jgi:hypothetical protein
LSVDAFQPSEIDNWVVPLKCSFDGTDGAEVSGQALVDAPTDA